jgi:hypothetical protein
VLRAGSAAAPGVGGRAGSRGRHQGCPLLWPQSGLGSTGGRSRWRTGQVCLLVCLAIWSPPLPRRALPPCRRTCSASSWYMGCCSRGTGHAPPASSRSCSRPAMLLPPASPALAPGAAGARARREDSVGAAAPCHRQQPQLRPAVAARSDGCILLFVRNSEGRGAWRQRGACFLAVPRRRWLRRGSRTSTAELKSLRRSAGLARCWRATSQPRVGGESRAKFTLISGAGEKKGRAETEVQAEPCSRLRTFIIDELRSAASMPARAAHAPVAPRTGRRTRTLGAPAQAKQAPALHGHGSRHPRRVSVAVNTQGLTGFTPAGEGPGTPLHVPCSAHAFPPACILGIQGSCSRGVLGDRARLTPARLRPRRPGAGATPHKSAPTSRRTHCRAPSKASDSSRRPLKQPPPAVPAAPATSDAKSGAGKGAGAWPSSHESRRMASVQGGEGRRAFCTSAIALFVRQLFCGARPISGPSSIRGFISTPGVTTPTDHACRGRLPCLLSPPNVSRCFWWAPQMGR